jgi:hypothetical protein
MITGKDDIATAQLMTLKHALKLEMLGIKKRGRSAYAILKARGYTGTRQQVLDQVNATLETILQHMALESYRLNDKSDMVGAE